MSNIVPIKIGIKFEPASLILVYRDKTKLRSRQIPIKNVDILTDVNLYSENFKLDEKYRKYFDKIPVKRLAKLIFIVQDNMKGYTLKESLERAKKFDSNHVMFDDNSTMSDLTSEHKQHITTKSNNNKTIDDYDIDDFHDSEDEEDKKSSTAKEESNTKTSNNKKSDALSILSTQLKTVKSNLYDFEDDDEEEEEDDDDVEDDDEDDIEKRKREQDDEKIETAIDDDLSEASF